MSDAALLRVVADLCRATAVGASVRPSPDWGDREVRDPLLAIARLNRCLPLLAPHLNDGAGIPQSVITEASLMSAAAWASYQLTAAILSPVLHEAHRRGITIIVYKGGAQAARFYSEPWRRQMQDIDLLVHPVDETAVTNLLMQAGYLPITTPRRSRSVELSHEHTLLHPDAGVRIVDLHTHPAPPSRYPFHYADLEGRSAVAMLFGAPVRFLSVEDELVISAVNQAYDHFRGSLLRAVDGAIISMMVTVDWNRVLDGARRAGARTAAWVTLRWMQAIAAAVVPEEVIAALAPAVGRRLWLATLLRSGGQSTPRLTTFRRLEQGLLTFPLIDDPRRFLGYVARHGVRRAIDAWRAISGEGR